ncbi:MAG: hypothetical protein ACE37J_09780 [Pikeienuella sp.]|uniref:hypothetical protein n=1 Tax=Pikeienuella sp. TaxID=2831957 RepID=UPI00391DA0C4
MQKQHADQDQRKILSLAHFISGGANETDALSAARARHWLDEAGAPTPEGLDLVAAVSTQTDTRSAFRNLF